MPKFNRETIIELSELCRIDCTPEEQERYLKDLQSIFVYFEELDAVHTEGVRPLNHVLETMVNVEREDEVKNLLSRDDFLMNAPSSIGGMIKVPPVIKGGS